SEEPSTDVSEPEETESANPETTEAAEPETTAAAGPASAFVEDIVFGWNLGNSLDSYSGTELGKNEGLSSETAWGNPKTTQEMIDLVRDSGVNAVRVPVTWYNHMDSNYVIDEEWMDRVQEVVDYVIHDDLYCIINVHHDTGANGWLRASDTNLEENKAMFAAIWEQVSARFADYDEHLIFEGFNEILNDTNEWVNPDNRAVEIVNELNQLFVDTVRTSGGNNAERVLIVNTYCAGGNSQVTMGFVLPTDSAENSLVVEAHIYQPYNFTAEEFPEVTIWSKDSINSYLRNMYTSFVQKGIPVIVGEFGCADKGNDEARLSWAKYYMETCRGYGIKCFWWDNGTAYKIFSRRNLNISEANLLGTMIAAARG
ncbi:MAG: glycoside hydrolase family 5 protein, partial [Acetatifactor sp.]|nr:glycoside hydrolase family 5 protein [Acetatifactor sp.]